ncbi:hypothetical protein ACTUHY_01080 [Acidaminococcus sp. LBK-2]|uniref:hypothetical protein n=1 Tax=Acidaminococcus sp. LBK-2 TaxID=3456956 RepID=UPI003FA44944
MPEQQTRPQAPEPSAQEQAQLKKKKRKKIALGAALAVLVGAVSGWYFLYYTRTPQYAVKLIRESVNKHDIVTFQDHTDLTRVVEKGYDAILTAQGENDVEDGYTEGEKDEISRHLEELIHNGVLTGDWTDSYRKTNPDKVLPVEWTALKVKDIQPGARYPQDALVNVQMDNPTVGAATLVLHMHKNDKGNWQLVEITNLKGYYGKILQKGTKKKQARQAVGVAGAVLQAAQGLEETPLAPLYEVVRDKVQEATDSGEADTPAPGTRKKSSGAGRSLPPALAVPSSTTSPETLQQQRQALQKALDSPIVGNLVEKLVDHQDEILAKLEQLAQAAQNGQGGAAIQQEMGKYQDQLRTIGKILDLAARYLQ